jgi:hypothetical protein
VLAGIFKLGNLGCRSGGCGCNTSCSTTICALSPCIPSSGTAPPATAVTVTVSNSSGFSVSGTTPGGDNPLGCVVLTIPATGVYTVATSGNARYNPTSGTFSLGCADQVTIPLTAADGFVCSCLANEPISANLLITGGTGTATVPSTLGSFTLPATVPIVTTDNFGTCNGTIDSDPCSTGSGSLDVQFTFGATTVCNDVQQQWCAATDCTENIIDGPANPIDFYFNTAVGGSCANASIEQWGDANDCLGYTAQTGLSDATFPVPQTVPLSITLTFPPTGSPLGTAASNPPISTITITEM